MSASPTLPVHLDTLGFARNPFPQTPDADCHFRTEDIKRQFTEALHCVQAGKGFVLLTGEVGTGKSTFLRCLMDELLATDCTVAFVFNTFLQGRDLLLAINRDFGLEPGTDLADDLNRLNLFLIERHSEGHTCVVVIDDAQNLDAASLELLRLLSNLETRQNKLLQIVLSGQPELLAVLETPGFRQLASRIVQHVTLSPLDRVECARYVDFRIARAGSDGRIGLTAAAQRAVHRHSRGNPRRVHLIMDRCLYGVLPTENREIGKSLVDVAASEVGIVGKPSHRLRKFAIAGLLGIGVGVAAWAATRPVGQERPVNVAAAPGTATVTAAVTAPAGPAAHAVADVTPAVAPKTGDGAAPAAASAHEPVVVASIAQALPAPAAANEPNESIPTAKSSATPSVTKLPAADPTASLAACVTRLGAAAWLPLLQNGLDANTQPALERSLSTIGLALAPVAPGVRAGTSAVDADACMWNNPSGRFALWRPAHAPFTLAAKAKGDDIRWLQIRLAEFGNYDGSIDGIVGRQTIEGLAAFRVRNGLASSANVDGSVLYLLEHGATTVATAANGTDGR